MDALAVRWRYNVTDAEFQTAQVRTGVAAVDNSAALASASACESQISVSRLASHVSGSAALTLALTLTLTACGFHLRQEAQLPAGLQRVTVTIADPFSPLKRNLEAALKRSGAKVEDAPGDDIAEIKITAVTLAPLVRSVGSNARVNEFSMVYHVEMEIADATGRTVLRHQVIEQTRDFTFDQTQAIGTSAEQDEIKKEMERDMVQAVVRRVDAAARKETGM